LNEIRLACSTAPWGPDGLVPAISEVSRCGFEGLECPGSTVQQFEDRLHVFEEILESVRLRLATLLQPLNLLDVDHADEQVERAANAARFAAAAGSHQLIICHSVPFREEEATDSHWSTFSAVLEEIGHRCREFEVEMCFLPRAWRLVGTEKEIARLMTSTRAEYVKLAVDTAEIVLAGGSPQRVIKHFERRLRLVRYRDASGAKRRPKNAGDHPPSAPPMGRGGVDFEAVSKILLQNKYEGWVILDVTGEAGPPAATIAAGHRFLLKKSRLFPAV
jgi:sugar phosphate isomerase/epimerase